VGAVPCSWGLSSVRAVPERTEVEVQDVVLQPEPLLELFHALFEEHQRRAEALDPGFRAREHTILRISRLSRKNEHVSLRRVPTSLLQPADPAQ
jgi:hypothetical protein